MGVPQASDAGLLGRRRQGKAYGAGAISGTEGGGQSAQTRSQVPGGNFVQAGEHGDDVTLDLYVARDVRATDAELARRPEDAS
jgi:hypothetical protein